MFRPRPFVAPYSAHCTLHATLVWNIFQWSEHVWYLYWQSRSQYGHRGSKMGSNSGQRHAGTSLQFLLASVMVLSCNGSICQLHFSSDTWSKLNGYLYYHTWLITQRYIFVHWAHYYFYVPELIFSLALAGITSFTCVFVIANSWNQSFHSHHDDGRVKQRCGAPTRFNILKMVLCKLKIFEDHRTFVDYYP